ncbi:LysR family transcriptional regulator [Actinomadura nitritigenes]|uniref:LysR family transcriptional regulator n=1 Tax=Actinomadura nitritigenes TaxID=134602 RepID=A0ABS3QXD4_9ACTN|nr:LysR family transcriptional regulator [Actinomadura nitritigenes]
MLPARPRKRVPGADPPGAPLPRRPVPGGRAPDWAADHPFPSVVEHRAFGRAAPASTVTQPALTEQIQALEAQVGGRSFHRGRCGATLTGLGLILLPEAEDPVRRADAPAVCFVDQARIRPTRRRSWP